MATHPPAKSKKRPREDEVIDEICDIRADQLHHILKHTQRLAFKAPDAARQLLMLNPTMCYALLHAEFMLGMTPGVDRLLPVRPEEMGRAKQKAMEMKDLIDNYEIPDGVLENADNGGIRAPLLQPLKMNPGPPPQGGGHMPHGMLPPGSMQAPGRPNSLTNMMMTPAGGMRPQAQGMSGMLHGGNTAGLRHTQQGLVGQGGGGPSPMIPIMTMQKQMPRPGAPQGMSASSNMGPLQNRVPPKMGGKAPMGMMQGPPGMGIPRQMRALTPLPGKATTASKAGSSGAPPMNNMRPPAQKGAVPLRPAPAAPLNVADLNLPAPGEKLTPEQRQKFLDRMSQIPSQQLEGLPEEVKTQIRQTLS